MHRRGFPISGIVFAALTVACGDSFLHSNPYDPNYPLAITIAGPDTLFSAGEIGRYAVTFNPPVFADSAVTWLSDTVTIFGGDSAYVSDGSAYLRYSLNGTFLSVSPPLEPASLTIAVEALVGTIDTTLARGGGAIEVKAYRHTGFKSVVVTQHVTRIQLRCPVVHACAPLTPGSSGTVWVDGFDALGQPITGLTDPALNPATGLLIASYVSRDPSVASVGPTGIRAATVTAHKTGTTWVVAMRNVLRDSLQIIVQ